MMANNKSAMKLIPVFSRDTLDLQDSDHFELELKKQLSGVQPKDTSPSRQTED